MWEVPSIASMTGGRPGCMSSCHKARKTGQEASGLAIPSPMSCSSEAFAGSGMGSVCLPVTLVFVKNAVVLFALRIWESSFAV